MSDDYGYKNCQQNISKSNPSTYILKKRAIQPVRFIPRVKPGSTFKNEC